jgi:FkbM family methyltransferase
MDSKIRSIARRLLNKLRPPGSRASDPPYDYLLAMPRYNEHTVKLLGEDFRIADSSSFYWSYREIFIQDIYRFESPKSSPLIIDCGANYGTSIVYFNKLFPSARIIGVEADPVIFNILEWNMKTRGLEHVKLLNRAVSLDNAPVKFYSEGADGGRLHYLEDARKTFEIDSIKLDDLIEEEVDFLKVDIEGAETEAICGSAKLDNVSQLFIEYHSFTDSEQTLADLLHKLSTHEFRYYVHTEFCSPRPLTQEKVRAGMDLQLNIFAKKNAEQKPSSVNRLNHMLHLSRGSNALSSLYFIGWVC